ncbi:lantibiotic dehydratase [Catellatospora citrea]|uniref:lantibiotic dehydratase n=1 Tax=Catellatospora citrea TaxID=53366 RepID=UPI003410FC1A
MNTSPPTRAPRGEDIGTAGARSPAWSLGPQFMLRSAGLPVQAVHGLRSAGASAWADEIIILEERLRGRAAHLSDLLHELIGANSDDQARRRLLALRRQVFKNALPADPAGAVRLVLAQDVFTAAQLSDWIDDRRRVDAKRAQGAALLAADLDRNRAALRELIIEDRLRLGLLLASPVLEGQLDALHREVPGGKVDKKLRKLERSVLSYLYRTACKTSPFSTFTGIGLGGFDGSDEGHHITADPRWSSHVRLNVVVLGRLAELILADPARRGDLPVTLSPGWRREEDRVRYVRRWVTVGDDSASVSFDSVKDGLFFLRRSGILDRIIELFADGARLRCRDIVDWLARQPGTQPHECEQYLSTLLRLGMLQVQGLETDVHTADPVRAFQASLRAVGTSWAFEVAGWLDTPLACLDAYPAGDVAQRRRLLAQLRESLQAIQHRLGDESATLPQALVYEDVRAGEQPVRAAGAAWRELFGPAIAGIERILPAFDMTLAHRITFKGFFLARFGRGGRCDDMLGLVEDFHEDLYDQYVSYTADRRPFGDDHEYVPEENWLALPGITALDAARRQFAGRMRKLWEDAAGRDEIVIDDDFIAHVAEELAPVAGGFVPQGHFMQLVDRPDDPLLVLNQSFGGLSFPFSRFTHCFDGSAQDGAAGPLSAGLRRHAAAIQPAGAVFAEVTGGSASTNLNLHGQLTDYVIVCPGESSTVPEADQLPLDDLYLEHDAGADRVVLRSRRLDREVIPVYLGYLMPMALPEISRTLLLLSPASMARLDVWGGVAPAVPDRGVSRRPRVRHGRLVVSRRSWSVLVTDLPLRNPAGTDADWFLDWNRWRAEHGVPRRVFATLYGNGGRAVGGAKPQYLDFDSFLSLTAFEALVKSPEARVVLREMLPAEDELHVGSARGDHVAEFAIETLHHAASPAPLAAHTDPRGASS